MNLLTIEPMKELNIESYCVQKCSFLVKEKGGLLYGSSLRRIEIFNKNNYIN